MTKRTIVVCPDKQVAAEQEILLQQRGYTTRIEGPFDSANWDPTPMPSGDQDNQKDCWLVVGKLN